MKRFQNASLYGMVAVCLLLTPSVVCAQGMYAPGIGVVNRSMGSAAVATPIDSIGAIAWNPASISGLECSEMAWSVELLIPQIETSSFVPGLGGGETASQSGATPLPNLAWVHKTPDPNLTIGFGVLSVAGFTTNYPADPSNPIFAPQRSAGTFPFGGFGRVFSEAAFIDMAPTIAYAVNDQVSFGVSPVITMGKLEVEPMVFAGLDDADGDTVTTYPRGHGSRYSWGGGANLGVYYVHDCNWRFGASVKTPRFMDDFRFYTEDELGNPQTATFEWDLPLVASVGTSYSGFERTLLALDIRYVDYANAKGLGGRGLDSDGALNGLGWRSVLAVATGVQYQLSDTTALRFGYLYNQNPIPDSETMFNVAAPLHYQHTFTTGLTYRPFRALAMHVSYSYSPESTISGPITLPPNAPTATPPFTVPGSEVENSLSVHAIDFGVTVRY